MTSRVGERRKLREVKNVDIPILCASSNTTMEFAFRSFEMRDEILGSNM